MSQAFLIYPHQLFENISNIDKNATVFLIEEPLFFTELRFHKQKLMLHRASMQAYKDFLIKNEYKVIYINYHEIKKTEDISTILADYNISHVTYYDPVDNWLSKKLTSALDLKSITYNILDTPLFLTRTKDLDIFFRPLIEKNKKFLMRTFYEWQRKRLGILLEEDGSPIGGKWSCDEDNRDKIPREMTLPSDPEPNHNEYIYEALEYVEKSFKNNYGEAGNFFYPVTHKEAKKWLDDFLINKLDHFGPYEDAISSGGVTLYHSILSPLLNIGLLTPEYVLEKTLNYAEINKGKVRINSLEGFVRQLIGWREYIRAVYVYHGVKIRNGNYFNAYRQLPITFWNGETGIDPVDDTIKAVLKYAYSHHITRLMVMGNFMNLCGYKPDDIYKWFMELYIDAYDWVMVPNVYSMALYADGGLITTKPYISGSAYIIKMSNFKKGEWSLIWDALFWTFVGKHYDLLSREGRLGFVGINYAKMSEEKKGEYKDIVAKFCKKET